MLRYISFFQSAEWGHEFLRYKLIKVLGEETVRNILPYEDDRQFMNHYSINEQEIPSELRYENMVHPSQTKVGKIDHVDSWYENAYYLNQDVSYGFVVSGKYTDSKKPVISTELHISSRVPGNFYLSKISTPSLKLSGSSVTGIPFFYQGSNEDLSWAGLPMLSDTIDIYVHTLNPNDPDLYLSDGKWEKIHKISYKIDIKGENSKEIEIKYTKYGPILENSSVLKQLGSAKLNKGQVMSVRWAGNEVKDTDFDAVMELYHAKNSRDVRRSLEGIKVPNLSFLYATKVGDIGYQSVGAHPKRKFYSVVPLDGSTSDTDWDGFLAYEELPYSLNPYKGYFVIAGNKPISSHYKHSVSLSGSYDDTKSLAISNSIEKIIKNKNFTVSDAVKIQSDNTDLFAKKAVRVLTSNLKQKQSQTIAKIFENWDFSYDKISQQAELFQS